MRKMRVIAAVYFLVLGVCAGSHYLHWNLLFGYDKAVLGILMFVALYLISRWPDGSAVGQSDTKVSVCSRPP